MLQQMAKDKYSIETLRELNVSYDREHWLTQDDVDMANNYVQLIERTRSEITPQVGDRVVYVTEHGDYYGHALIDHMHRDEERLSVCERPYVPFVWKEDGSIRLSVSGGAFHRVNPKDMKFLKWTEGAFKDWGSCGACANGSVTFLARVPLWFYAEPNPKYGNYTTETYRKFYLNKRMDTEKAIFIKVSISLSGMKPISDSFWKTMKERCSRVTGQIKSWYGASVMKTVLSRKTNGIKLMNRLLNGDSIFILNKSR